MPTTPFSAAPASPSMILDGRYLDVSGFSAALGLMELPIILGAVAYDHPITGKVYILVFHQTIYC
jgi:hypothetical protein